MQVISCLPHELLGEVFADCAACSPDAPLALVSVSHLFRAVAYSTPAVWTHLNLEAASAIEKAALWFAQSRVCRVHVQLDLTRSTNTDASAILDALRLNAHRISSLLLRVDHQAQALSALSAIYATADAPTLHALTVHADALKPAPHPPSQVLAFPPLPGLAELEVTNITLALLPSLDLGRLQRLRLVQPLVSAPFTTDDVVDLLSATPALTSLWLEARISDLSASGTTHFMQALEDVHLRANNLIPLLDRLIPPRLHSLYLDDMDGRRAGASEDVANALHRLLVRMELGQGDVTNNELREFELVGVDVDRETTMWDRCMQKMKALEVFRIREGTPMEDFESDSEEVPPPEMPHKRPVSAFAFGFGFAD
ncbi:hypothetical protein MKEN_01445400 [Mycena kentingensis (nom. inval.)]|nr:hypothetical protein MKEN_01445400 [Mycena kentingensis (nom. inval.)]